ncbi:MAG: toxin-antitoxin system protein [Ruminococcus sp.]|nr:toxin-antitoxin system protein [Ruminococcus sp.]
MKNSKKYRAFIKRQRKISRYGTYLSSKCSRCGNNLFLFDRFDAECCIMCDIWTETKCGDPECEFCSKRPDTPFEALFMESERIRPAYDRKYNLCIKYHRKSKHKNKINFYKEKLWN